MNGIARRCSAAAKAKHVDSKKLNVMLVRFNITAAKFTLYNFCNRFHNTFFTFIFYTGLTHPYAITNRFIASIIYSTCTFDVNQFGYIVTFSWLLVHIAIKRRNVGKTVFIALCTLTNTLTEELIFF